MVSSPSVHTRLMKLSVETQSIASLHPDFKDLNNKKGHVQNQPLISSIYFNKENKGGNRVVFAFY